MQRTRLPILANNPNLIAGIYNYCDRWCERCPLTSRCLVYATEQNDTDSPENHDNRNAEFWRLFTETLTDVRALIPEWAKEALDPNQHADKQNDRRQRRAIDNHPLAKAGKHYANATSEWFHELDQPIASRSATDEPRVYEDARGVIEWYQYQIAVKTMRALSSRNEEDSEDTNLPKDSDGSAKVALIGIDRSIAAWRLMQLSLPDRAQSIVPLILQLDRLHKNLQENFPGAQNFTRPGFDEPKLRSDAIRP